MKCCPWPVVYPCDLTGVDPTRVDLATHAASMLLWGLSGRRFGECIVTTRYRVASCAGSGGPTPYKGRDGQWRNAVCDGACCRLELLHQPVRSVEAVEVDGVELDASEWIHEGSWLTILSGCPVCNDCGAAPIRVRYRYGADPGPFGFAAAGEVACELLKGWAGDPCKLSTRAVSVTRQGVTIDMLDAADLFEQGLVGLPVADSWIRTVNPNRLVTRSRVLSPDLPRPVL